jgi:hypothetical protein
MTTALSAIEAIDDGYATAEDRAVADVFDRHISWTAVMDVQLDRQAGAVCSICGGEVVRTDETAECDTCVARWDAQVARSADV